MPEPRRDAAPVLGARFTLEKQARDPVATRRRYRHGTMPENVSHGVGGIGGSLPVEIRNGMPPFRPYVYRGTGHDILTAWMGEA